MSSKYLYSLQHLHHQKTISTLGVLRNHIAAKAVEAVQRHLSYIFCSKRLQTLQVRAEYVASLFRSDDDHPIIWREYVEGDIQNHPEIGGYKTVCFSPHR